MPLISIASGGGAGVAPVPPASDLHFDNVVYLCHFDQDSPILDNSNSAHTISTGGGGALDTAVKKFGAASWDHKNAITGFVLTADHADWDAGTGDYTAEVWSRWANAPSATDDIIISNWAANVNKRNWMLLWSASAGALQFKYSLLGSDENLITGTSWTPTAGVHYHLAWDRDSAGDIRIYVDGVVQATGNNGAQWFNGTGVDLRVGGADNPGSTFDGWSDEARVTKGVARYGGAFTPPSAPFPDS